MNCPLCIDQALEPNYRGGIEIDICPNCKGVWLDRGEIDKLASDAPPAPRPAPMPQAAPQPAYRDDPRPYQMPKGKQKRKKSLAERLGDVLEEVLD